MGNIIKKTLLVVAGKSFPVTISEENEQLYRDAANNVDCLLHKYQKLYYSTPKDDIYVMVLLDLSIKNEEYRISEKKRECEGYVNRTGHCPKFCVNGNRIQL